MNRMNAWIFNTLVVRLNRLTVLQNSAHNHVQVIRTTCRLRTKTLIRGYQLISVVGTALLTVGCADSDSQEALNDVAQTTVAEPATETVQTEELTEPDAGDNAIVSIGSVRTLEVNGVVFTSLPEATVDTASASVELGRLLFWDPVLSGDQDIACATCHLPEFGYTDGRALAAGTSGVGTGPDRVPGPTDEGFRNAQSVLNTVWNGINEFGVSDPLTAAMFWDGRTQGLVNQALEPIRSEDEMRGLNFAESEILPTVLGRLSGNSDYQVLFERAFDDNAVSEENLAQALADFQSTLIANNTPYDRWMRGEQDAMSDAQLQGLSVFAETGCAECHSGPMFSDFDTHVLGVPEADGLSSPDTGDGNFGFRTPTLRQLAFTAPYFHGGQESELDEVIDFYDNPNASDNPNVANNQLDPDFRQLPNINGNEAVAIEAFLESLNDSGFDQTRPATVPSGLPVGGAL